MTEKQRCWWVGSNKPHYEAYHDKEWGVALFDDLKLFEMLILEGAQAGLSWETILLKRQNYQKAFHNFDPRLVASMTDQDLEERLLNPGIVRNRLKVFSTRKNARIFLDIQTEFQSFATYAWGFVDGKQRQNAWGKMEQVPSKTAESDRLSKDLKKRGMSFVGSTIIYAWMQSCGLVNDHLVDCWRYQACCHQNHNQEGGEQVPGRN